MILGFLNLELSIVMKKLGTIGILSWLQPVVIWDFLSHDHPRKIYSSNGNMGNTYEVSAIVYG
jgi:hypothetical protein